MSSPRKQCPTCPSLCHHAAARCIVCETQRRRGGVPKSVLAAVAPIIVPEPEAQVASDREHSKLKTKLSEVDKKYKSAMQTIESLERRLETATALSTGIETYTITPTAPKGTSEATAVVVASDWHVEESVGAEVGSLNTFSLEIARQRAEKFFLKAHRLINLLAQDITIDTIVLALLGDFITGNIHGEENAERNETMPTHAIVHAQNWIASGIQFLLDNTDRKLVIPCHSGNHARTTLKTRFGAENGHSLEFLMYHHLAAYFRNEPRVTFIIPEGPHSYLNVYDQTIRFHHGHMVSYGGGVGGIFIPAFKKIAKWNEARHADLDVFGHFHQTKDGGSFLCNGSLIGYNSYALSIGASFEKPRQTLFLMDKKRGRTCTWPILLG